MHPVFVITISLLPIYVSAQEQVKMTLLSINHFNSEANGQYQCHLSDPDETGTTVTSYRAVDTRNGGTSNNPDPPDPVYKPRDSFPHYKVTLDDDGNDEWFGVFGCEATKDGKKNTSISTTRMRSDADFVPVNELFTQTVNINDKDAVIIMQSTTERGTNGIRWRKDNSDLISPQSGRATFSIPGPIQHSDAGTYECHYAGERDMAKQGLNLLLVRACPFTTWGPPGCLSVCDSCYNGGICDENNGKCICAPGFKGDNCRQACGGNKYGHTCELGCSSGGGEGSCGSYLFCLAHPFGCKCNTGWKGLGCNTVCQSNTFGASCLQTCHCKSNECNRYTGICTGSDNRCKPGWTGNNCQECDGTNFGTYCTQECHCGKENCNKESGLCKPGGCLPQWVDLYPPFSCQTGLENISYTKMNPEIPVPVTCQAVEGPGGDLNSLQLVLSRDPEILNKSDITSHERSDDGTTGVFTVTNIRGGDILYCQLRTSSSKMAVLTLNVEVFVLPVLTSSPVNTSVGASLVTISWSAWDENTDEGDPPLVGYIPYFKDTILENIWVSNEMVYPHTLMYTFTGLSPERNYLFSVSAVREGEGGEGPKSPELSVRTICNVPPKPEEVTAEVNGEDQENIKVTWQLPSEEIICSSGITKFTVFYSWGTITNSVDVPDPTATSVILHNLTHGVWYTLFVTLSTSGGASERSDEITHLVPVLPSLSNQPTLEDITCNSVIMVWDKWTEGIDEGTPPIMHYIPYHKTHDATEWIIGKQVNQSDGDLEYNVTFHELTEDSLYDFCVVPVREGYGGEGYAALIQGNTTTCNVEKGPSSTVIAVSTILPVLFILLIILAVVIIVRMREKKKSPTTDYDTTGATNNSYVKDIHKLDSVSKRAEQREGEDDEAIYTNLDKPVSILVADLAKYIRDCENGRVATLEQQFQLLNGGRQFASCVGDKEENKTKNRFKNMVAYDHSRVILDAIHDDPHSDYYNANYIKNVQKEEAFIASQGPNKASVGDFWRMVWKENVQNIVMLTNLVEDGKDRCIQYWPPTAKESKNFGNIFLKLTSDEQFGNFSIRKIQVTLGEDIRTVTNWHFKTWPDKDVPDQPSPLIEFARRIKLYQQASSGHLLVHCSAGVGRTGTFIALYTLMDVLKTDTEIDIYGYVEQMRRDRINMVQTEKQYKFLHESLLEIFLAGNTKIPIETMGTFDIQAERDRLNKQFKLLAKLDKRSVTSHKAKSEESEKSRYPDIIPLDKKRPFLQTPGKTSRSNYINACFTTSYRKKNAFIATQSPLPNTVEDFWRLVYDWKCPLIVMLNQLDPSDKTCCKYWPESESSRFGNMKVKLKEEQDMGNYVHRQFELTDAFNEEPRLVQQMQLKSWDERNQRDLSLLVREMEKLQQDYSMVAPTVVHCLNGVGRTGVFLTVKSEMERMSAEGIIDVFNTVRQLRGSNHSMVYTKEEYYLCHQLLHPEIPESHYANI